MNIAVILAGGVGSRVGADCPKQFIEVLGKPVIAYTIEVFQKHEEIDAIEVVCLAEYIEYLKELTAKYRFDKVKWIVEGGDTFQESVINGIHYLQEEAGEKDIALIHYAASPFVSDEIISDCIRVCKEKGNCISATPCFLLMGTNDGDKSVQWVDREKMMQLNSPQCFEFGYVVQLYDEAAQKGLLDKVEPHTTSLMYALGRTIYFAKGNQTNIKITTREDLELFEGYVMMKMRKNDNIYDIEKN